MATSAFDLEPMSIGDILDRTVRLYQRSFLHTVGIAAVPYLLIIPLAATLGSVMWIKPAPALLRNPGLIAGAVLVALGFGLVFMWLNFMSMGALARSVSEQYLGRVPSFEGCYGPVVRRTGALLWTYSLSSLLGGGLFLLGVIAPMAIAIAVGQTSILLLVVFGIVAIAGVVVSVRIFLRFFLVTQVVVIEDVRGREALGRSWILMSGNESRAVLISLFGIVVSYIVSWVLNLPVYVLAPKGSGPASVILGAVAWGLGQVVSIPFMSIPLTLLYYDSRIRKEAFDLEMMAQNLGVSGGRVAATDTLLMADAPPTRSEPPRPFAADQTLVTSPSAPPPSAPAPPAPRRPVGAFKVCPKCAAQVPLVRPACPTCGTPLPFRSGG